MNLKRAFIALGAMLLGAGFLGAAPAMAASLQTVSNGGVTCEQWPTNFGTYPNTYWVCTANHAAPSGAEMIVGQTAKTQLTADMKVLLANTEIMIFQNQNDFHLFTGAAAPATKYVAWAASSGPGALAGKRIAAVFATADLYSTTVAPTNTVANRDITAYYKPHIMQGLGRNYDALVADATKKSGLGTPFKTLTVDYDEFYLDKKTSSTVWGATLAGQAPYVGRTPWEIFGILYGNDSSDLYAFEFMNNGGWSHLDTFLHGSTKYVVETQGFMAQQIYQSVPAKPYLFQDIAYCVQYTTTSPAPVNVIWDCVHPYDAQGTETTAGVGVGAMPSAFLATLNGLGSVFYTFYDYTGWNAFTSSALPSSGVLGATKQSTHQSGAFSVAYNATGTFATDAYYRGTLVHEASHQLDHSWAAYAPGETAYSRGMGAGSWGSVVAADVVQFNALTCMAAINNTDLCTNAAYAGRTNYERFLTGLGLYGQPAKDVNEEMFCYMMQKKSGQTTIAFLQYVENKFWALGTPNMKSSIDTTWANGHP